MIVLFVLARCQRAAPLVQRYTLNADLTTAQQTEQTSEGATVKIQETVKPVLHETTTVNTPSVRKASSRAKQATANSAVQREGVLCSTSKAAPNSLPDQANLLSSKSPSAEQHSQQDGRKVKDKKASMQQACADASAASRSSRAKCRADQKMATAATSVK